MKLNNANKPSGLVLDDDSSSCCDQSRSSESSSGQVGPTTTVSFDAEAKKRLAKSRERNREHAKRTRLRKKKQLQALQGKVKDLEAERQALKESIEDCSLASILLNLSSANKSNNNEILHMFDHVVASGKETSMAVTNGKRKRSNCSGSNYDDDYEEYEYEERNSSSPSLAIKLNINGKLTTIGGSSKSHINWKNGTYTDELGKQLQLTPDQLISLKRERNRMHAKMTRERKRNFVASIEQTIQDLEEDNKKMKTVVSRIMKTTSTMENSASRVNTATSTLATNSSTAPSSILITPNSSPKYIPSSSFFVGSSLSDEESNK